MADTSTESGFQSADFSPLLISLANAENVHSETSSIIEEGRFEGYISSSEAGSGTSPIIEYNLFHSLTLESKVSSSLSEHEVSEMNKEMNLDTRQEAIDKWFDAFVQLKETQKMENYSPDLELPSQSTVTRVIKWLYKAYDIASSLPAPDIVPDGTGELDIEWEMNGNSISIHIRADEAIKDIIYFQNDKSFESFSLNNENLKYVLKSL
jgi:hypothetical protein